MGLSPRAMCVMLQMVMENVSSAPPPANMWCVVGSARWPMSQVHRRPSVLTDTSSCAAAAPYTKSEYTGCLWPRPAMELCWQGALPRRRMSHMTI